MNYIINYLIQNNAINWDFVNKHTKFKRGETNIGYGLRPEHPLEKDTDHKTAGKCTILLLKVKATCLRIYCGKSVVTVDSVWSSV